MSAMWVGLGAVGAVLAVGVRGYLEIAGHEQGWWVQIGRDWTDDGR